MEEIKDYKNGVFCWVDLATSDTDGAKKFYADLFGWTAKDMPEQNGMVYTMLYLDDKPVGALYAICEEMKKMNIPPNWLPYVSVDNCDETTAKAKEFGCNFQMEPTNVGNEGRMAVMMDPEGAVVGLWQAKDYSGAMLKNVPGAMCWNEHGSHEPEKSIPALEKVFGWTSKTEKMGDMEYTTFLLGEEMVGGLYIMPEMLKDIPSHWMPYFQTDNIDLLIEKATAGGGEILMPKAHAEGVGYFVVVRDPQGAAFGVVQ